MITAIKDRETFRALARARHHAGTDGLAARAILATDEPINSELSLEGVRVGYAISRRVGNAVVRNRLRRRLRTLVAGYHQGPQGPLPAGAYLFIARSGAGSCTYADLAKQVNSIMSRLRVPTRSAS